MALRKDGHPGIHTATTSPCLVTRRKSQRSVSLRKDRHSGIHTAPTSPCLLTGKKSQRSVKLQRLVYKTCSPRHSHNHDKSIFTDTTKKSEFGDTAAFSDAKKTCALRHSHSHDKSVFRDTTLSDVTSFSDVQKRRAARHSHGHDKPMCSCYRLLALQRLVTHRKYEHPGIHTVTTSPYLVTR